MRSPLLRTMRPVCLTIAGLLTVGACVTGAEKEGNYALSEFKHGRGVWGVAFSPDDKLFASAGEDRTIRIWDIAKGEELRKMLADGAVSLSWSPGGKMLASAPGGGAPKNDPQIWDPATGKELRRCVGHANLCYFVAFSPDGKLLASASADQTVRLWDPATGKEVRILRGHIATVLRVAFSPNGKMLASVGDDHTARLWETATGTELRTLTGHTGQVLAVNFSPDGRLLATGGGDGTVRLWDVRTGKEVRRFTGDRVQQISSICFSRDGRTVAVGMASSAVTLVEVCTGRERWVFEGHKSHVYGVTFSHDGKTLATGGGEGRAVRWDWMRPGRDSQPMSGIWGEKGMANLWTSLGGEDATAAFETIGHMTGAKGEAVRWIKDHLKPAPPLAKEIVDAKRLARLIADLDDEDFDVREKASADLRALDQRAESAMRKALEITDSAEVKKRLEKLLERFDQNSLLREEVLAVRAVEVLERIGSAEAKEVLRGLAKGDESARLTEEARTALERLGER